MENCTGITYTNGKKELLFYHDPVVREGVATVAYPKLTSEQLEEVKKVTYDKVQDLLNKLF